MIDIASPRHVTPVVVNYNGGELLTDCVQALLGCASVGELIVVDNASSDDSLAFLERAVGVPARLHVVRNESNIGYGAAANLGMDRVRTEFALIVNPDCVVHDRMVEALLAEADATPRAAVCGGLVLSADGSLQNATRRRYPSPLRALRRALRWQFRAGRRLHREDFDRVHDPLPARAHDVDAVSGALMLVRMAAVSDVGGYDEAYFLHCEDLDWCVRFRRAGWGVRFVPAGFAVHAKGASGGVRPWRIRWHMHRGMTRFYRKFEAPSRGRLFNALIFTAIWMRFAAGILAHPIRVRMRPLTPYRDTVVSLRAVARRIDAFEAPETLVIGATSPVARFLLEEVRVARERDDAGASTERAASSGWWLAVNRRADAVRLEDGVVRMRSEDGANLPAWARERLRHVVHLAPLWTLLPYLENLAEAPLERVVACSSTSVVTRRDAAGRLTDPAARRIAEAEEAVRAHCDARGIELVILRPTLIYAPGEDRNVERIARLIRRFGVFPVAGCGAGRRQPVHAEDVAHAARAALRSPAAAGRCYAVSGAEVLTYREMVERLFRASGRRPRIVSIPVALYRLALLSLRAFGDRAIDPEAAARMDADLSFDHAAAARDLDFRPRPFMESAAVPTPPR